MLKAGLGSEADQGARAEQAEQGSRAVPAGQETTREESVVSDTRLADLNRLV